MPKTTMKHIAKEMDKMLDEPIKASVAGQCCRCGSDQIYVRYGRTNVCMCKECSQHREHWRLCRRRSSIADSWERKIDMLRRDYRAAVHDRSVVGQRIREMEMGLDCVKADLASAMILRERQIVQSEPHDKAKERSLLSRIARRFFAVVPAKNP